MKLLVLLLFLAACAKPNYVDQAPDQFRPSTQSCQFNFATEELCLRVVWETIPNESQVGSLRLTFSDPSNGERLLDPRHAPLVFLWMPSMGHGSSPVTMERLGPGVYQARDVFFIMPGIWEIRYQLKEGSTVIEEVIETVTI